jgi:hypothetical protein
MKKHSIKIAGREFPLAFSLNTMVRFQDENPDFNYENIDEEINTPRGLVDVMYSLAKSGAAQNDQVLDVSKEWMAERISPTFDSLVNLRKAVVDTLSDGMHMETLEKENKDREVDVVLEELKKKEVKTD